MSEPRDTNKRRAFTLLGGKRCFRCGVSDLPDCCFDFDHINPAEKKLGISRLLPKKWSQTHHDEILKCRVVCACCHRIVSAEAVAAGTMFRPGSFHGRKRRLNDDEVAWMRKLHAGGLSFRQLGRLSGVSHGTVHKAVSGLGIYTEGGQST